ncbi:Type II secretion system protein D [Tepidimonas alkaliphilus]|uniref:Type II secretion system protein D n=1 Tax=Tepidimonas alkaliphilus TaxID=2588942 RepID=A0A554W5K3_9BURK|nr:type II secretion system secretin GspD [Tepidimonas alkaliphilus]TSE18849.1 Type II secretion system protein D [Tepidimonas alkaliphilus]
MNDATLSVRLGRAAARALLAAALAGPLAAQTPPPAIRPGQPITLNFVEAEIEAVARALAVATGRAIVVDPRVKGPLTLITESPVRPAAALAQFGAELRLRGFALVESAGILKIVPEAEAKLLGGPVLTEEPAPARDGLLVTQIFRLQHENANHLLPILRPLISPNNPITVNNTHNALVITDYADNLQRLARIIAALDVGTATDLEVVPLKHAIATDVVGWLRQLLDDDGAPGPNRTPGGPRTTVLADPRSNSLLLRASHPARLQLAKALIDKLDRPSAASAAANIHVVYLRHADAVQLATTLRAALAGAAGGAPPAADGVATNPSTSASVSPSGSTTSVNAAPAAASVNVSSAGARLNASAPASTAATGGQVQADPANNALIITAPEPLYRELRRIIDLLDVRRAQVYVESLIAEVSAEKASEIGVQWQSIIGRSGDGAIGLLGTNFGSGGANILNLATQNGGQGQLPAPGFNIGLAQRIGGTYVLSALARFLETQGDANILSTPTLLTLDNEEAKIVIGQNVPFITGQYTANNSNQGAVNPFQTIERRDVGLTLRVRPQIQDGDTVRLQIFQEVSSVLPSSINNPSGLITNKRSIESTVLVEDGGIVVLGGLLQDEFGGNQDKVPGLGDVPVLGHLFRSEKRSRKKTNLMVFLRPVVVRDARAADALALDRYQWMRSLQQQAQPQPSRLHPIQDAPLLPPSWPGVAIPADAAVPAPPSAAPTAP